MIGISCITNFLFLFNCSRSPTLIRRHRSESISRSPRRRQRFTSPVRRGRSPKQSPPRRKRSPLYTRSPRRRSPSPWRRRPSPPMRRRSPPPLLRRRSPSPPLRRRSPSPPLRRRSPVPRYRRRSPIPSPKKHQVDSQSPRWRKRYTNLIFKSYYSSGYYEYSDIFISHLFYSGCNYYSAAGAEALSTKVIGV
jgi:hypothetical protein